MDRPTPNDDHEARRNKKRERERIAMQRRRSDPAYRARQNELQRLRRERNRISNVFGPSTSGQSEPRGDRDDTRFYETELYYDDDEKLILKGNKSRARAVFRQQPEEWSEEKRLDMESTLNRGQLVLLHKYRNHIRRGRKPELWFVQGGQGTGKSYLVDFFEQDAIRCFKRPELPTRPFAIKMAYTGKSTVNISGCTIHAALRLFSGERRRRLTPRALAKLRVDFQNCRLILVDEASFLGHNLLHYMSERLQEIKRVDEPFGGIHVVLFGDLRQLPPVNDTALYLQSNQTPDYFSDVRFYELTEVMRQRGDWRFAVALNNYAVGKTTPEDVELLKSRETTIENVPNTAHLLFFSNREVDGANLERLNDFDGESTTCPAFEFANSRENKQSLLDEAANLPRTKTNKLSHRLPLKVGARYMVTHNLDTSDGLVNGGVGILRRVEMGVVQNDVGRKTVKRAWMEMEGERTGEKRRRQYSERAIRNRIPPNWTPVDRIDKRVLTRGEDEATVHWKQLPLTMAEAMTIHKAQGSTFEECAVFLKPNMSRAMTYVALSRVKSLENLYIVGDFHPSAAAAERVEGDDPISRALEWLRERVITSEEDAAVSEVLEKLKESASAMV